MSTATSAANKDHLTTFFRLYRDGLASVIGVNGMILIRHQLSSSNQERSFCVCVGEYDGDHIEFTIDGSAVLRYVRQVKAGDEIAFRIDRGDKPSLVLDSDKLGEMTFECSSEEREEPFNVFDELGGFKTTIDLADVLAAKTIIDRTDQDSSRFALATVQFEDGFMVATDGRRLVALESSVKHDGVFKIPSQVIEYAAKFSYEIDVFDSYCIAGDSIVSHIEGRFPQWQQVFPNAECEVDKTGDELRKVVDTHLARMKAAGETEKNGVDFTLHDDKVVKLDANFVKVAVAKLQTIKMSYPDKFDTSNTKYLTGPVMLTSDERPGWREVIMPMAWDR